MSRSNRPACPAEFNPNSVRAEAARRQLPMYKVAVLAGTNPPALSRVLNGRACASPELRKRLGEILGIKL